MRKVISFVLMLSLIITCCINYNTTSVQAADSAYLVYENMENTYPPKASVLEDYPYYFIIETSTTETVTETDISGNETTKEVTTKSVTIYYTTEYIVADTVDIANRKFTVIQEDGGSVFWHYYTWIDESSSWGVQKTDFKSTFSNVSRCLGGNLAGIEHLGVPVFNAPAVLSSGGTSIVPGSDSTSTVPSGFSIEEPTIGDGVVITIPATLDLAYDEQNDSYRVQDFVSAKGDVDEFIYASVSCPKEITYSSLRCNDIGVGRVKMGTAGDANTNYVSWTSSELKAGYDNEANLSKRSIAIDLPLKGIAVGKDMVSTIEFDLSMSVLGLNEDISSPAKASMFNQVNGNYDSYNLGAFTGTDECLNLSGVLSNLNNSNSNIDHLVLYGGMGWSTDNTTVKFIQLEADSNVYYCGRLEASSNMLAEHWLDNLPDVEVLIIPENTPNLQCKYTSTSRPVEADYSEDIIEANGNVAGNAIAFVKSMDSTTKEFNYVPHIVYRGTVESWKALSGKDNWVFGNMSNDMVTVHCTDGNIIYR